MKIGLFILVLAVVLGGLVGTVVVRDPGYVLLAYGDSAVETSLWFAALLLLIVYFLIRIIVYSFSRSLAGSGALSSWVRQRKTRTARQQTVRGLLLMAEGEWQEARKLLVASADEVGSPLINYLNAARAAHELGDAEGRDDLLRQAHESTPGSRFAVALTQAQLQMAVAQWEQCLATLLQLKQESPRHPQVLAMLRQCYQELADWPALIELLPVLKKEKVLPAEELTQLQLVAWRSLLATSSESPEAVWRRVPKDLKRASVLIGQYAQTLAADGPSDEAESAIRAGLQHIWDEELVALYGQIEANDAERQLKYAENWLKERPNDPTLLLALGRICMMNHQWAKAREYMEASLRLLRTPEVYGELGRLCTALGDAERGSEYFSQSLRTLPALPLPSAP